MACTSAVSFFTIVTALFYTDHIGEHDFVRTICIDCDKGCIELKANSLDGQSMCNDRETFLLLLNIHTVTVRRVDCSEVVLRGLKAMLTTGRSLSLCTLRKWVVPDRYAYPTLSPSGPCWPWRGGLPWG